MDTTRDAKGRFIKGKVIDNETELKRLVHFEESWKKRENYNYNRIALFYLWQKDIHGLIP